MNVIWENSSSSDFVALSIVDGTGIHHGEGPHYSRRTPGSKTFTGVGQEVVLVTSDRAAVWAVVRHKTPMKRGTGYSRGRNGDTDTDAKFVWRNMLFRNLSKQLSSDLIKMAVAKTYLVWGEKYGCLPTEKLRTEVDPSRIKSKNPGYCYKKAGFHNISIVRKKVHMYAPCPVRVWTNDCACCHGSQWSIQDSEMVLAMLEREQQEKILREMIARVK